MSAYLPDWLLPEILYRLPIQSLLRFSCVSKQWYSFITSPHFISTHITHSHSSLVLLRHVSTRPKNQEKYFVYLDTENLTLVKEIKFPFKSRDENFRIVGFCNGVFCLSDDLFEFTYTLILWNPAIRRSVSLPKPRVHFDQYGPYMFCLGFGFDKRSNDMKVVRISYLQDGNCAYTVMPPEVEVYSVSSGVWRTVDSKEIKCRIVEYFYSSVCLNGAIHWVSFILNGVEFSNRLLVFDLGDEMFSEMGLPERLANVYPLDLTVNLCGDRISVIWYKMGRHEGGCCVVWVMNEYGEMESWTKKFVVLLKNEISHSVGFMGNREFLVEKSGGHLMLYDPVKNEFKDVGIIGKKNSFFSCEYVESLVLLDGNSEATTDFEDATDADPQIPYEMTKMELKKEWSWNILCAKASLYD